MLTCVLWVVGLPLVNIAQRDMIAADILLFRGVFNSTTNFILGEMGKGRSYADALLEGKGRRDFVCTQKRQKRSRIKVLRACVLAREDNLLILFYRQRNKGALQKLIQHWT